MTEVIGGVDLLGLISEATLDEDHILELLVDLSNEDRRKLSHVAIRILKQLHDGPPSYGLDEPARQLFHKQDQLCRAVVYATATLPELKKLGWRIRPDYELINKIITLFKPGWVDEWSEWLLEVSPNYFDLVNRLYLAGRCTKPTSDNYILGLITTLGRWRNVDLMETLRQSSELMEVDLWRVFSIEGGGEFSLAANDKHNTGTTATSWTKALVALSDNGEISRERLLNVSLDALDQDFAQFRAGWFSRFHEALSPTQEERAARTNRYLHLLGSRIPPTVTFALKALSIVNKKGSLPVVEYMDHVSPAIEARTKSTVMLALRILENLAKNHPDQANELAGVAAPGLIHESADVQKKILDIVDRYGVAGDDEISRTLALNGQGVAPSLKKRLALWVDETEVFDGGDVEGGGSGESGESGESFAVADIQAPRRIPQIDTFDELLARFSFVLENPDDPIEIETVLDGILRIEIPDRDEFARLVGPLRKRAEVLAKRGPDKWLTYSLAVLALSYSSRANYFPVVIGDRYTSKFQDLFLGRLVYVAKVVECGKALPLLSMPTHGRSFITPAALLMRYRLLLDLEAEPPVSERVLSLLRLDVSGFQGECLTYPTKTTEFTQALRFAMGENVAVGSTPAIWIAAARARDPNGVYPELTSRFGELGPDGAQPASYEYWIEATKSGRYTWHSLTLASSPEVPSSDSVEHVTVSFHENEYDYHSKRVCGEDEGIIRWAATVWPGNLEPFFSDASRCIGINDNAQWYMKAYFEPLLEVDVPLNEMAILLIANGLGAVEPGLKGIATEIVIAALDDGRLDVAALAECMAKLLPTGYITVARWTKVFKDIATVSHRHAVAVRNLIQGMLRHDPAHSPRNLGGLIELLYELQVAAEQPLNDERAIEYLKANKKGGKLGTFAKRLVEYPG